MFKRGNTVKLNYYKHFSGLRLYCIFCVDSILWKREKGKRIGI